MKLGTSVTLVKNIAQKIEKSGLTFDEYYARHF